MSIYVLPRSADLTDDLLIRLVEAAEHPRGSEDDMFCARYVPALVEALRIARLDYAAACSRRRWFGRNW